MVRFISLALVWLLAGCAALPPAPPFDDAAFGPPVPVVTRADIFAASPAMRAFLAHEAASELKLQGPQLGLVSALWRHGRLRIDYDASVTRTASQSFEARAGHCLSLVLMTASLARELGLPVRFQQVPSVVWERRGGLEMALGHVNIAIGPPERPGTWYVVDFLPEAVPSEAPQQRIDEARLVAMVHNNRAAESLADGRPREAYWSAREALREDPGFADAWNTLGVVYTRRGDAARAEEALRHALAVDDGHGAAMGNLAGLLAAAGRMDEATLWRSRQARVQVPPFVLIEQAQRALAAGDAAGARDRLLRALRDGGESHELHFALARAYAQLGQREPAARHLEAAARLSPGAGTRERYAAKLDRLRATELR